MAMFFIALGGAAAAMLALDAIWLTTMARLLYQPQLGDLLTSEFRAAPAALFYLIYLSGVVYFAVAPSVQSGDWRRAALRGALLGLFGYGTYDLTNQATFRHWPWLITLVDLTWGTVLTALSAAAGFFAVRRFHRSSTTTP